MDPVEADAQRRRLLAWADNSRQRDELMIDAYARGKGLEITEIAAKMSLSRPTVYRVLAEHGAETALAEVGLTLDADFTLKSSTNSRVLIALTERDEGKGARAARAEIAATALAEEGLTLAGADKTKLTAAAAARHLAQGKPVTISVKKPDEFEE